MTEIESIQRVLFESSLTEVHSALEELRNGANLEIESHIGKAREELLSKTYEIRLKHLSSMSGDHAKRLIKSTTEFVDNLNLTDPEFVKTARIKVEPFGTYLIWFTPDTYNLLGCMYLVSENEVGSEKWKNMWG